jgi:hypothetical protein
VLKWVSMVIAVGLSILLREKRLTQLKLETLQVASVCCPLTPTALQRTSASALQYDIPLVAIELDDRRDI